MEKEWTVVLIHNIRKCNDEIWAEKAVREIIGREVWSLEGRPSIPPLTGIRIFPLSESFDNPETALTFPAVIQEYLREWKK